VCAEGKARPSGNLYKKPSMGTGRFERSDFPCWFFIKDFWPG